MTIAELIAEAKATVIDGKMIDDLEIRMKRAEEKFEEASHAAAAHKDFMSRTYSL